MDFSDYEREEPTEIVMRWESYGGVRFLSLEHESNPVHYMPFRMLGKARMVYESVYGDPRVFDSEGRLVAGGVMPVMFHAGDPDPKLSRMLPTVWQS